MWAVLITTLPSRPNAVRLRVWRALKALGCGALRDGAYLLPAAQAPALQALADEVRSHGGSASVLSLAARSAAQQAELEALFDRSADYAAWRDSALALQAALGALGEHQARRRLRTVAEALAALQRTDHLPGAAAAQAQQDLANLRNAVQAHVAPGEPTARAGASIARLDLRKYQARRWATRARPGVDRLACAWLVRRFIDPQAVFVWLADPARPPRGVVGFDYDGARFSHVGARVSVEVLAASFGLDADPALARIGAIVRCLDAGGIPVPEAAGLGAVLAGLQALHADDDKLLRAARPVFDALYAAPEGS
jgi:hypothetical protein